MAEDRVAALVVLNEGVDAEPVRAWFVDAGFAVRPLVGISFSIEAPRSRVEELFEQFAKAEGTSAELSLERLPEEVRSAVRAVVSETPPDFGPGNP